MALSDVEVFEIMASRYYEVTVATLSFYDYFLTLPDEVRYMWKGQKTWVFPLFLCNRYVTMLFGIWSLVVWHTPAYPEKLKFRSCNGNIPIEFFRAALASLLAQVFLVARLYALTGRKRIILVLFSLLSIVHVGLWIASMVVVRDARMTLLLLGPSSICFLDSRLTFIVRATYTLFSLAYDALLLLIFIRVSYSTCGRRSTWPAVLKAIVRDSGLYFLAVLGSHFLMGLFMVLDPQDMRYFSSVGISPLTPVMISRLILSLREAGDRRGDASEQVLESLVFGQNPGLPQTQTRVELFDLSSRRTSASSDELDLISPPPAFGNSPRATNQ